MKPQQKAIEAIEFETYCDGCKTDARIEKRMIQHRNFAWPARCAFCGCIEKFTVQKIEAQ